LVSNGCTIVYFLDRYTGAAAVCERYLLGGPTASPRTRHAGAITGVAADPIAAAARRLHGRRALITVSHSRNAPSMRTAWVWMGAVTLRPRWAIGLPAVVRLLARRDRLLRRRVNPTPMPKLPHGRKPSPNCIPVRAHRACADPGSIIAYNGLTMTKNRTKKKKKKKKRTYPDLRLVYWAGGNPCHHHHYSIGFGAPSPRTRWWLLNRMYPHLHCPPSSFCRDDDAWSARISVEMPTIPLRGEQRSHAFWPTARDDYAFSPIWPSASAPGDAFHEVPHRPPMAGVHPLRCSRPRGAGGTAICRPSFDRIPGRADGLMPVFRTLPTCAGQLPAVFPATIRKTRGCRHPAAGFEIFSETIAAFGGGLSRSSTWLAPVQRRRYLTTLDSTVSNQPTTSRHSRSTSEGTALRQIITDARSRA